MALQLGKKPATAPQEEAPFKADTTKAIPPKEQHAQSTATASSGSALKRGKAAAQAFAAEDLKASQSNKSINQRFWLTDGGSATLTFLDGDLDSDGMLDIPYYFEHNISMGGKYGHFFACNGENEPCAICEGGTAPSFVGLLSVIDHRSYTTKADGKEHQYDVKLFAAKRQTLKMLQKYAEKRDGLAGCTFDASRTGAQSAAVGSMFDFTDKMTLAQIAKKYGADKKVINYDDVIGEITFSRDELKKLGFGSLTGPIGSESSMNDDSSYEDKL